MTTQDKPMPGILGYLGILVICAWIIAPALF